MSQRVEVQFDPQDRPGVIAAVIAAVEADGEATVVSLVSRHASSWMRREGELWQVAHSYDFFGPLQELPEAATQLFVCAHEKWRVWNSAYQQRFRMEARVEQAIKDRRERD